MGRKRAANNFTRRSALESSEIQQLSSTIEEFAPSPGVNPLQGSTTEGSYVGVRKFADLPLSQYTKDGLAKAKFKLLTAVQRACLPHALAGRDVLGAAKTGSGKTLAFLIPVIEKLYRSQWGKLDGLGALILTPIRELAMQIFEELKKVGKFHDFSAGLLIGGKDVKAESTRVSGINILVATPGRLLQHMDETPGFDAASVQVLVLDEADRILDMGFAATLDAILDNLPRERQTLLFSATQTKSVKDLARLSLSEPEYLSVHAGAATATPLKLKQMYTVCPLPEKMNVLWSFIKSHLACKTIVFLSTCKQVKFVHDAFKRLRPGVPVSCLHGKMKQMKRMAVYYSVCEAAAGVLFATDVAARGLDFPGVDWVLQADCPEDTAAYIHRVGRTARFTSGGNALLLLCPSEVAAMTAQLEEVAVPIKAVKMDRSKVEAAPVTPSLAALLSKHCDLKDTAAAAVVAYFRSYFLQPNKAVFDVTQLPAADFAASLGLVVVPKLKFLRRQGIRVQEGSQAAPRSREAADALVGGESSGEEAASPSTSGFDAEAVEDCGAEDDLLTVKAPAAAVDVDALPEPAPVASRSDSKTKKKKQVIRIVPAEISTQRTLIAGSDSEGSSGGADSEGEFADAGARFGALRAAMKPRDLHDRELHKQKRREEKAAKKAKARALQEGDAPVLGMQLGGGESDSEDGGEVTLGSEGGSSDSGADGPDRDSSEGVGMNSDDESDEAPRPAVAAPGSIAHELTLMRPRQAGEDMVEDVRPSKRQRAVQKLSVSEQEALALRLLG